MRGPTGFPPAPLYRLLADNCDATGPALHRVSFQRRLVADDWEALNEGPCPVDEATSLRTWLRAHGGEKTAQACDAKHSLRHTWVGRPALQRLVQRQRAEIEHEFAAMVQELGARHVLLPEQARDLRPQLEVVLLDARRERRGPLPDAAALLWPQRSSVGGRGTTPRANGTRARGPRVT